MWRFILFLIILVASVSVGIALVKHPGFLLLVYGKWMMQTPLWFALLTFLLFCALFYLLINGLDRLHLLSFKIRNWFRFRRNQKAVSQTQSGLLLLIESHFKKAEKLLLNGMNQSVEPLINYLGAAKAAHAQGAFERRDSYLEQAHHFAPNANVSISIVQAELELGQGKYEQAKQILETLSEKITLKQQPRVLQLLEKVYVHLHEWQKLLTILPYMRKTKLISDDEYVLFEKNIYREILQNTADNLETLHAVWQNIPTKIQRDPAIVTVYAKKLALLPQASQELEELIRKTLKNHYQPELIRLYGTLPFANLNRQLVIAGAWLKLYGAKSELYWLLGKLCMRLQLWGKAKDYFEKCLQLGPNIEATLDYGKLLEQLGSTDSAREHYREALDQLQMTNN